MVDPLLRGNGAVALLGFRLVTLPLAAIPNGTAAYDD
jgi:hypothetical protein